MSRGDLRAALQKLVSRGMLEVVDVPMKRREAAEIAEHEAYLDALDKAGGGPCAWRAQAGGESA